MNWIKNNLGMLLSTLVFVALLGVTGWKIHEAFGERRKIESELEAKQQTIQARWNAPVFPSKENIEALHRDRLQLLQIYSNIQDKVSQTIVTPPEIKRDAEFNLFLVETQSGLRKLASESNTNLTSNTFGFDRYRDAYPCRAANLRGTDCERLLHSLVKQIVVVDKITRLLIESGTDDILDIKRAQAATEIAGPDTILWTPPTDPKALFTAMPFQFKFACDKTHVLQTFLNKLASADLFLVVKYLTVETESQIKSDPNVPMSRVESSREPIAATVETKHRLIVTVRIDWVEFTTSTNTTARTTTPANK